MKISIFGLGYVGVVSAACFAELGNEVIGVDISDYKVDTVNNKESPIAEQGLSELIAKQVEQGRLIATKDYKKAVLETDVSFICVGTPPKDSGDLDLSILERVCSQIGSVLQEKENHIIVIRSTIFPGSFEKLKKILEESSGKIYGKNFNLITNPEFLREGTAVKDFFEPPVIVIGSENEIIAQKVLEFYKDISSQKFIVEPSVAQMIKYVSNSFHALKISFTNEISRICKKLNINDKKLMEIFCADSQLNISPYYMKPGFAYGGSCLPKDTVALKNNAQKLGVQIPIIDSIEESNFEHINEAIKLIKSQNKKRIGFLGIAFKKNTDDIRGNPLLLVINTLLNEGFNIKIWDKIVKKENISRLNKSYRKEIFDLVIRRDLKQKIEDLSSLITDKEETLNQDVIIISTRDKSLKQELQNLSSEKIIIDLQNLFEPKDFSAKYKV